MIIAKKSSFFRQRYTIMDDERTLAKIKLNSFREQADITIDGLVITIKKKSAFKSDYELDVNGNPLAFANKLSLWKYDTLIKVSDQEFLLKRANWFSSNMAVIYSGRQIGLIKKRGWFTSDVIADLPASIPIELRIFMLIIKLFYRNRDAAAASS